ncbi:lysozyme-like protein [Basidiobolus meristosporus CBS 931.73]|uniref:Lysozyme-like protein n=1 Tax=Basidiobolus meristosporus CBS 931.73 TaxID=1314790 RepID=A0A1Y1XRH1_9FUNG|nr:lysozyme-like protein [Basidiobolus meristosporus CBS 931.73]|eukprot:ORX88340.1 lysozyme-like protein [Basidiobolus meristosporus CBS 931.73]
MISNVFEHSRTDFHYQSCRDLDDKRGYTCGFVGFTTSAGEALTVIQEYLKVKKDQPTGFEKYLPTLNEFSNTTRCHTEPKDVDLYGFTEAWKKAACDEKFRQVQVDVADQNILRPAIYLANKAGIHSDLGRLIFYDTALQHGYENDDGISLRSIMRLAGKHSTEYDYLNQFLRIRRRLLCCFPDEVWPESANRVSDLMHILENENFDLQPPIRLESYHITIEGDEITDKECKGSENSVSEPLPSDWKTMWSHHNQHNTSHHARNRFNFS